LSYDLSHFEVEKVFVSSDFSTISMSFLGKLRAWNWFKNIFSGATPSFCP